MWTYDTTDGKLYENGREVFKAYTENLSGLLPDGLYTIAPASNVREIGDHVMRLTPIADASGEPPDRRDLFIHGVEARGHHNASDGCIILPHAMRAYINGSVDRTLRVVSGMSNKSPIRETFVA